MLMDGGSAGLPLLMSSARRAGEAASATPEGQPSLPTVRIEMGSLL